CPRVVVSSFEAEKDKPQSEEFVGVCRARTALLTPDRLCSTRTRALLPEEMPMSLQPIQELCTEEDYLALERASEERHEYLDGRLYAMAGESPGHDTICTNLTMPGLGQRHQGAQRTNAAPTAASQRHVFIARCGRECAANRAFTIITVMSCS